MGEFFHSVKLDKDKCMGCINCIKRCPTEAIRVRNGKAVIISERCIDCGECIRICPHHAKRALYDPMSAIKQYKYPIALVPPSLFGQFNNLEDSEVVIKALKKIGFSAVVDVGRAAELVSEATRRLLEKNTSLKPVISSACPAVVRLIRVRFPELINQVLPLVAPMELAARIARREAVESGVPEADIGCIFITPCPAKVTAIQMPMGSQTSQVDAAIAVKELYPHLLGEMSSVAAEENGVEPLQSGRIGLGWGESGGEAAGLLTTDAYLAADGIENVIRVLEDLEDHKYRHLEYVELNACAGGCVGGVLQVENPYIAKAKIKKMRRYLPVSLNHLEEKMPREMRWDASLKYAPVMELGNTKLESFALYEEAAAILQKLPGLDCGSCGSPTCASFAEDIVRNFSQISDCTVLMRRRMEAVLRAIGIDEEKTTPKDRDEL